MSNVHEFSWWQHCVIVWYSHGSKARGNIFRGVLAPSHGACGVVHLELDMSFHWLPLSTMQLMHHGTCSGHCIGLVRTVTMNIVVSCLCVLYIMHHGSGLACLYWPLSRWIPMAMYNTGRIHILGDKPIRFLHTVSVCNKIQCLSMLFKQSGHTDFN